MKVKKHKLGISLRKMKKGNKDKEGAISRISEFLELPSELVGENIKVISIGNKDVYIEGKSRITEYDDTYVRLASSKYVIEVTGKNLEIKETNLDELYISGKIANISYEGRGYDEIK